MIKKRLIRRDAREWRKIIADQESSGVTVAKYCRERKISGKSFYGWQKRFSKKAIPGEIKFIEIKHPGNPAGAMVRITTPGGYKIEVPADAENGVIGAVMLAVIPG